MEAYPQVMNLKTPMHTQIGTNEVSRENRTMMNADHLIVEVDRKAAGILARIGDEFEFFASSPEAFVLDRRSFPTVRDAINAVAQAIRATCH